MVSESHRRAVRLWLYAVAALVVLMVMVGGATRLTDSGLSIVEWRPVTGTVPPLSAADWAAEFGKYKTSSEYEIVNKGMTLDAFKRIYWWEWGHRLLGRIIGAVFFLPLLLFVIRGWIEPQLKWRLWLIFGLGGLQGAIGWWMVKSGLAGRVDVAQERLAIHLTLACIILVAIVWAARSIAPAPGAAPATGAAPAGSMPRPPGRLVVGALFLVGLLLVQIALGGIVAGLKAGLAYNTWPLIDGAFIPAAERLFFLDPVWSNFLDNHLTAQFIHRMVAYLLVACVLLHAADCIRHDRGRIRAGAVVLTAVIIAQATLGIATLLWQVPMGLALAHQSVAILALVVATVHAQALVAAHGGATEIAQPERALSSGIDAPAAAARRR
jgi:heme a synthase